MKEEARGSAFSALVLIWIVGLADLEGLKEGTTADAVIGYCNDWHDAVAAAGYVPGIYVGAQAILDGVQLFRDLKFNHYWRSLSVVPDVEARGYQMVQSNEHTVNGISIDDNLTHTDQLGGKVLWLSPV